MRSVVKSLRAPEDDWARWQEAADASGMSFNAWAKEALNSQVDLDMALARLEPMKVLDVKKTFSDFKFRPDPKTGKKR